KFRDTMVKLGGGICDKNSIHLSKLLDELNIKKNYVNDNIIDDSNIPYSFNMNNAIDKVKEKYYELYNENKFEILNMNVNEFLIKYFGESFTSMYYNYAVYSDFKFQDINDYILRYPIDDEYREIS